MVLAEREKSRTATAEAAPQQRSASATAPGRVASAAPRPSAWKGNPSSNTPLPPPVALPNPEDTQQGQKQNGRRGAPAAGRRVRGIARRSPMTLAVLAASFSASLLCLYVSAYARVTVEGHQLVKLQRELATARTEHRELQAAIDQLQSRPFVIRRAKELGMKMAPPEAQLILSNTEKGGDTGAAAGNTASGSSSSRPIR